jgi:hypothetical protein
MCTVTYVPVGEGFYLTSNRDESITRSNVEWPSEKLLDNCLLTYPRDITGNGTWIAVDNRKNVVCLLNGAFRPHKRKDKYRHSRGLVVLNLFTFNSIESFYDQYNLEDIEPFTLVMVFNGKLNEFKWDGEKKHLISHPAEKPHIWSSVTLYNPEITDLRNAWFTKWLVDTSVKDRNAILSFHQSAGLNDPENNIMMKRSYVQTLSITSVKSTHEYVSVIYYDLISGKSTEKIIEPFEQDH